MTINSMHQVGTAYPGSDIGAALSTLSWKHVAQVDGVPRLGFGYENCNAAVAVTVEPAKTLGFSDSSAGTSMASTINPPLVAVYGSSRLYAGLDPGFNGTLLDTTQTGNPFSNSLNDQHAEQTAILFAETNGFPFWQDDKGLCHVYVDFTPCDTCEPWLRERPEAWVVHYGHKLENKSVFLKERKLRSRNVKAAAREAMLKRQAEARVQRLKDWSTRGQEARRELMDKKRAGQ